MSYPFEIDSSLIKSVDDETARELVVRLCKAELRSQGLPASSVTSGGDQRASDGGVDVRVNCPSELLKIDFLRSSRTLIQVKAEKFGPAKIGPEMAPKGLIRPAIEELREDGGSYLIVSTKDDCSDRYLKPRQDAIVACLEGHGLEGVVVSDFYDSRRIADWVEQHPEVVIWLRSKLGQPLKAWRPYGAWAYREEDANAEYLVDDRVKVFAPNSEEGNPVSDAIIQLRRKLQRPVSIRIVGLSGVGKTRLIQALFDRRVCPDSVFLDPEHVVYCDLADEPNPSPSEMMDRLAARGSDSVVVVDNCGFETHARLTEIVRSSENHLKLVTVEYDIRDDIPEGTDAFRLDGSSSEIVTALIARKYSQLSNRDCERIAAYSNGNARIAFALASTAEVGGELCQLRDEALFLRLFEQKKRTSEELLRCAEIASLLYSFDGDNYENEGELALLAELADLSSLSFSRHIDELRRRGLVQCRAQWRAVLPHVISNRLAARALESLPLKFLSEKLMMRSGERVTRSFTRRIGYLHDCSRAVEIATELFAEEGMLGDPVALSSFQIQMFENMAPVAPKAALDAIARSRLVNGSHGIRNENGNRLVRVLRAIAYEAELFDVAARVLVKLALGDSRDRFGIGARRDLQGFCHVHLSGTHSAPSQRVELATGLLDSVREDERELGVELLRAGLKTRDFTSSHDTDFGMKQRDHGWRPKSDSAVFDWFCPWIELAVRLGSENSRFGRECRSILGKSMRGLCAIKALHDVLANAAEALKAVDGWGEGWLGLREALSWDCDGWDQDSLDWLRVFESRLAPSNLNEEIRAKVITSGAPLYVIESQFGEDGGGKRLSGSEMYRIAEERRIELGKLASGQPEVLVQLIPELCSANVSEGVFEFGFGVGTAYVDRRGLLDEVRSYLNGNGTSSASIRFVLGFVSGWSRSDPDTLQDFLDHAVEDSYWITRFVSLQTQAGLSGRGFDRLCTALGTESCPTGEFSCLQYGRAASPLTVPQIAKLIKGISARSDSGSVVAVDVLAMIVHGTDQKDESYCRELGIFIGEFLGQFEWGNDGGQHARGLPPNYEFEQIAKLWIRYEDSHERVAAVMQRILETVDRYHLGFEDCRREVLAPIFEKFPVLALDLVCAFGGEADRVRARTLLVDRYSERKKPVIESVPTEVLLEWCAKAPEERYPFVASVCELFAEGNSEPKRVKITDTALALWNAAQDREAVLSCFVRRFHPLSWSGSLASLMERRLRLFDELEVHDRAAELALGSAKAEVKTWIDKERARELEEERLQNSSFE